MKKISATGAGAILAMALGAAFLVTGCSWSVGGRGAGPVVSEPTVGQQLLDLKEAHDSGAISDAEYERLKARTMSK